jgi:hypothetical protein
VEVMLIGQVSLIPRTAPRQSQAVGAFCWPATKRQRGLLGVSDCALAAVINGDIKTEATAAAIPSGPAHLRLPLVDAQRAHDRPAAYTQHVFSAPSESRRRPHSWSKGRSGRLASSPKEWRGGSNPHSGSQVKPHVVHQLSLYSRLRGEVQGHAHQSRAWCWGDGRTERVALGRYAALHRHHVERLEAIVAGEPLPTYPEPVAHCSICPLSLE